MVTQLSEKLGVPVELFPASDYAGVMQGLLAGQLDTASLGASGYAGIYLQDAEAVEPVFVSLEADGSPGYYAMMYAKATSDIHSLEDMQGKSLAFADPNSTSGYLVPMKGLLDTGINLDTDLTTVMAGGHDASLLTLDTEGCDAAFAHDAMLSTLETSGQVEEGSLRPVWESDPITEDPIALNRGTLDPELADKITTVLREQANKPALVEAGICSSEEDCDLPEETGYGYVPVTDEDFDPIRDICRLTDADACKNVG